MYPELLNLPVGIQLSLASGYAAYHFAYVGIRDHHKTIDVAFITLVFGLVATVAFSLFSAITHPFLAGLAAFIAAISAGVVWRKWGRDWLESDLRGKDLTWANDDPSALRTITSSTKFQFTQVAVELNDGTWLECEDTRNFSDCPYGPFTLGPKGDLALYLTHEKKPNSKKPKKLTSVSLADWGDRMTYIPASQIRRMTFRMKRKSNHLLRAAVE